MALRTIAVQYNAIREDISDLVTRRALPTPQVEMIDPFLFLNHHGPQIYPQNNQGLPFGPHPHRGFETVTFILKGELTHRDTAGHESLIREGGVQWMTAGRGLVHSELSPDEFKKNGGDLEILQLWVNLPSGLKMTEPKYQGLQKNEIPALNLDQGRVVMNLVSGQFENQKGPIQSLTDVTAMTLQMKSGGSLDFRIPSDRNIFFYVVSGTVKVNNVRAEKFHLLEFGHEGDELQIQALEDSVILLCHAEPLNEPVAAYGPFVMNTREEIVQAIRDYQAGRFG